jgi:hypothetical protein
MGGSKTENEQKTFYSCVAVLPKRLVLRLQRLHTLREALGAERTLALHTLQCTFVVANSKSQAIRSCERLL